MTGDQDSRSRLLDQVIAEYLQAADAGESPRREELFTRYPELADQSLANCSDSRMVSQLSLAQSALWHGFGGGARGSHRWLGSSLWWCCWYFS